MLGEQIVGLLGGLSGTNEDMALTAFKKHRDAARQALSRGDRAGVSANVQAARHYFSQMGPFQSSYDDEMLYLTQIAAGDSQAVSDAAFSRARAEEAERALAAARARGGESMWDHLPPDPWVEFKKWLSANAGKIALVGVGLVGVGVVVGGGLSFAHGRGMRR